MFSSSHIDFWCQILAPGDLPGGWSEGWGQVCWQMWSVHRWISRGYCRCILGGWTQTSRRTGNRACEIRVLPKKCVFCHSEATIVVTWNVWELDVHIWAFLGKLCFRYSKTWLSCLFWSDNCSLLFHSIFRSICAVLSSSFLSLLMNLHCHILAYNMTSLPGQRVGNDFFAAGPRSINRASMWLEVLRVVGNVASAT